MQIKRTDRNSVEKKADSVNNKTLRGYNPYLAASYKNEDKFELSADTAKSTVKQKSDKSKNVGEFTSNILGCFKNLIGTKSAPISFSGTKGYTDIPALEKTADKVESAGTNPSISDISKRILDCDRYDELDEDVVKKLLISLYPDGNISDTAAVEKIEGIIKKFNNELDDCIYEDGENLNSVLEFIGKIHNIVGVENIDNYNILSVMGEIMDGADVFCIEDSALVPKLEELLKEPLSDFDSKTRIDIFMNIINRVGEENPDENLSSLIEQLQRLNAEFSGDDLKTALIEVYKNGVEEEKIVRKLENYALSSQVYKLLQPENIPEYDFNLNFSAVIRELVDRGYDVNTIKQLLEYKCSNFYSHDFIKKPNIPLFADVIEESSKLSDTSILTKYTTGQESFNDILTLPVANVDDLPVPDIDFSQKEYTFESSKQDIKELESVLKDVRTKRDMTVYRGEGFEVLNAYQLENGEMLGSALQNAIKTNDKKRINEIIAEILGAEIVQSHFMSTAYNKNGALNFLKHDGGGILWTIDAPKGSQGLYMDPFNSQNGAETEFLFNRNTKLLIKNAEVKENVFRIYAEIVSDT